jgi:hypothetical protein
MLTLFLTAAAAAGGGNGWNNLKVELGGEYAMVILFPSMGLATLQFEADFGQSWYLGGGAGLTYIFAARLLDWDVGAAPYPIPMLSVYGGFRFGSPEGVCGRFELRPDIWLHFGEEGLNVGIFPRIVGGADFSLGGGFILSPELSYFVYGVGARLALAWSF